MMQNTTSLTSVQAEAVEEQEIAAAEITADRAAAVWVSRITSFVGLVCLALALVEWAARPGHYRTVLALLTVAMFASILHSYTFENGH